MSRTLYFCIPMPCIYLQTQQMCKTLCSIIKTWSQVLARFLTNTFQICKICNKYSTHMHVKSFLDHRTHNTKTRTSNLREEVTTKFQYFFPFTDRFVLLMLDISVPLQIDLFFECSSHSLITEHTIQRQEHQIWERKWPLNFNISFPAQIDLFFECSMLRENITLNTKIPCHSFVCTK